MGFSLDEMAEILGTLASSEATGTLEDAQTRLSGFLENAVQQRAKRWPATWPWRTSLSKSSTHSPDGALPWPVGPDVGCGSESREAWSARGLTCPRNAVAAASVVVAGPRERDPP